MSENSVALQIARDKLVHLGTCIGKLTHSGKFRLTVGALDILAQHTKYKVRICLPKSVCCIVTAGPIAGSWLPDDELKIQSSISSTSVLTFFSPPEGNCQASAATLSLMHIDMPFWKQTRGSSAWQVCCLCLCCRYG